MTLMIEKYFGIAPDAAGELLSRTKDMNPSKRGIDCRVYLLGDYAVLKTSRLKLRNVTTRDDDLAYLDELIRALIKLRERGVNAVPILGYCYDPDSKDGDGYIFQPKALGEELYDDAVMREFYVQSCSYLVNDRDAKEYILEKCKEAMRANGISDIEIKTALSALKIYGCEAREY